MRLGIWVLLLWALGSVLDVMGKNVTKNVAAKKIKLTKASGSEV
jgi:hypothetical protein